MALEAASDGTARGSGSSPAPLPALRATVRHLL